MRPCPATGRSLGRGGGQRRWKAAPTSHFYLQGDPAWQAAPVPPQPGPTLQASKAQLGAGGVVTKVGEDMGEDSTVINGTAREPEGVNTQEGRTQSHAELYQ